MIARPQMDCTGTGNGLGVLSWQNSMVEYVASEEPHLSQPAGTVGWLNAKHSQAQVKKSSISRDVSAPDGGHHPWEHPKFHNWLGYPLPR